MALGSAIAGIGYVGTDVSSPREGSITPLTVHALFAGVWMGMSHFVAGFTLDTKYEKTFFAYTDHAYLLEAQYLATLMAVVPLLVGRMVQRKTMGGSGIRSIVPALDTSFSDKTFLSLIWLLVATDVAGVVLVASLGSLPIVGPLLRVGALGAIFMLAWHWYGPTPSLPAWTKYLLLALVGLKMSVAFLYQDMRGEIVYPLYAFYLAVGIRSAVTRVMVVGALAFLLPFSYVYTIIGGIKGQEIVGSERVTLMFGARSSSAPADDETPGTDSAMTLAARTCNFGQLSQVARIADEDGLYYGETLAYLVYIFIPRVVWPDKPEVTPGQWFARKLGKGQQLTETKFSNAINMTLAGEFYLNFGWVGAVVGLALYGFLLQVVWNATGIFTTRNNVVGLVLAFLLLMQGSYASSAAALPQIVIGYGSMLIAQMVVGRFGARKGKDAGPGVSPFAQPRPLEYLRALDASRANTGDSTSS
jgi:hypothetical protein